MQVFVFHGNCIGITVREIAVDAFAADIGKAPIAFKGPCPLQGPVDTLQAMPGPLPLTESTANLLFLQYSPLGQGACTGSL